MNQDMAEKFILQNARPLEKAIYHYNFKNGNKSDILNELKKFQNKDGGFGHGLEADNWNINSNPIATNDAIFILHKNQALDDATDIMSGIVNYLKSHDSFDEEKRKWLFAIESNKDYPHAIWWEKKDDGIHGYNPTISLATIMLCFGENTPFYRDIIVKGFDYLSKSQVGGDELKCFILSYKLLTHYKILNLIDLENAKELISKNLNAEICKDTSKYGVEYVSVPSDFFTDNDKEFIDDSIQSLIESELNVLSNLQKDDGGFDISWQWYTNYSEFEQARNMWRPRITIDKMLFAKNH